MQKKTEHQQFMCKSTWKKYAYSAMEVPSYSAYDWLFIQYFLWMSIHFDDSNPSDLSQTESGLCFLSYNQSSWIVPSGINDVRLDFYSTYSLQGLVPQLQAVVHAEHVSVDVLLKKEGTLQLSHVFLLQQYLFLGPLWSHRIPKGMLYH